MSRYCSSLDNGSRIELHPEFIIESVAEEQNSWLTQLDRLIPKEQRDGLFRCRLILPLSSPLRDEIIGLPMPNKRLAKRSVAFKACVELHKLGELNDEHLFPLDKSNMEDAVSIDEEFDPNGPKPGTNKRTQIYQRRYAESFQNCQPRVGKPCHVYVFDLELTQPVADEKMHFFPNMVPNRLGFLSTKTLGAICKFPIMTKSGEMCVAIAQNHTVTVTKNQLIKLQHFHQFVFQNVVFVFKQQPEFDFDSSTIGPLIVPLDEKNQVDYKVIVKITSGPRVDWENLDRKKGPTGGFRFDRCSYGDAVVTPWYLERWESLYVDELTTILPTDKFVETTYASYQVYFGKRYGVSISDLNQRLVRVSREISHKNFLLPRLVLS